MDHQDIEPLFGCGECTGSCQIFHSKTCFYYPVCRNPWNDQAAMRSPFTELHPWLVGKWKLQIL
jgi:hypothetical protein